MSVRSPSLQVAEDILPLAELEANAPGVIQRLRKTNRSVVLVDAGRPAAVLMTPEEFDQVHRREQIVLAIHEGLVDEDEGLLVTHEELREELEAEFGPLEP